MDDLTPMLKKWKYKPNDLNVRIVQGMDGRPKVQMRLDLGVLQMELDGRPDGRRPHRYETYLVYFQHKARNHKSQRLPGNFQLSPIDCWQLQQEAIQFYHRYLALMRLGDYKRVIRDSNRNLRTFDFVAKFNEDFEIIWSFEQYRPYVIMMNTRAKASLCLKADDPIRALEYIHLGVDKLKKFNKEYAEQLGEDLIELELLEDWAKEIEKKKPLSEQEIISQELQRAIKMEEYERAAILRDRLAKFGPLG